MFPNGSNRHQIDIVSDNDFSANKRQAIIWTSDGLDDWRIYASLGLAEIKLCKCYVHLLSGKWG